MKTLVICCLLIAFAVHEKIVAARVDWKCKKNGKTYEYDEKINDRCTCLGIAILCKPQMTGSNETKLGVVPGGTCEKDGKTYKAGEKLDDKCTCLGFGIIC